MISCGIMLFYSLGLTINCFSIFLTPLIELLQLSHSQGSRLISVQNISGMVSMIIAGPLYKKIGARKIAYISGLFISCGFYIYARADSLTLCYVAASTVGLGFGSGSLIPAATLISAWFDKKRGFALGVASAFTGVATIIYPPILTIIIDKSSVSNAFLFQSISIFILATVTMILLRNAPADKGLLPYGCQTEISETPSLNISGITFKEAIRTNDYYLLIIALFFVCLTMQPTFSHIAIFYIDGGYSSMFAAYMLSIYGLVMIIFKPIYGMLIDKLGLMISAIYTYILLIVGFVSAYLIGFPVFPYIFVICLGIAAAPFASIGFPIYTEILFGKKDFPKIYTSIKFMFVGVGSIAVAFPGIVMDSTGSYSYLFSFYILCSAISFIIMLILLKRKNLIKV